VSDVGENYPSRNTDLKMDKDVRQDGDKHTRIRVDARTRRNNDLVLVLEVGGDGGVVGADWGGVDADQAGLGVVVVGR